MDLTFTHSDWDLLSHVVVSIYKDSKLQIERDVLGIGPFKNGLMSVKLIKATEVLSRIYCVLLALSSSYLVKHICTKKQKRSANDIDIPLLSTSFLSRYLSVIEDTLLFHLWLKTDNY